MAEYLHGFILMGEDIELSIDHPDADHIFSEAEAMIRDYEMRYSSIDPASEVVAINQSAGQKAVRVSKDLYDLIKIGRDIGLATNGIFNIAIGPITNLWHVGFSEAQLPDQRQIETKLDCLNPADIILDDFQHSVYLSKVGMALDLGVISKGYFADRLKRFFFEKGVHSGMINLGNNLITLGQANEGIDGNWSVKIPDPLTYDGQFLGELKTQNQAVVISSINERKLKVGDKYYHHLFDARTGYPIASQIASVTIVSDQAIDGEIWSTVLFSQAPQKALQWLNQAQGIEGILVTKEKQVIVSQNLKDKVTLCPDIEMLG